MLLKRSLPIRTDYMRLARHSSMSITFDISDYYLIDEVGEYTVTMDLPLYSGVYYYEKINNFVTLNVTKNHLSKLPDHSSENLLGCTKDQSSAVNGAVSSAKPVIDRGYRCLLDHTCDAAANTWFGTYSKSNYDYDRDTVFKAIGAHMKSYPFKSVCYPAGCDSNVYAYVYPSDKTFTVYLCNLFFTIPSERVETVIHEMSHFNSLGGTEDYAYGRSQCKSLAKSNPSRASHNADNV